MQPHPKLDEVIERLQTDIAAHPDQKYRLTMRALKQTRSRKEKYRIKQVVKRYRD